MPQQFLPLAAADDGLFMRLGEQISTGNWLGPFDQMTLVKGPGYPVFLALSAALPLSISTMHGLFQLLALGAVFWLVRRLTASWWWAVAAFLLLAVDPVGFLIDRIIRDQIYWPLSLITVSCFGVLLLADGLRLWKIFLLGPLAGVALGWTWLTREEGLWLLPGIAVLYLWALAFGSKRWPGLLTWALKLGTAGLGFAAVLVAVMTMNLTTYGAFIGVDITEPNFVAAYDALQRVDVGPLPPYVPVPDLARAAAASVSPTFAPLAYMLTPGQPQFSWEKPGCQIYPKTCGDIAGGWFLWALRDAAAQAGFYQSPRLAALAFDLIADELKLGCQSGRIKCRPPALPLIPQMTAEQWAGLPDSLWRVGQTVFIPGNFGSPPPVQSSSPDDSAFSSEAYAFLHAPVVRLASTANTAETPYAIRNVLIRFYQILLPPLVLAGAVALLAAIVLAIGRRNADPLLGAAIACWVFVATRMALLGLIDIGSFPAANVLYAAPLDYLAPLAALVSLAAWAALRRTPKRPGLNAESG